MPRSHLLAGLVCVMLVESGLTARGVEDAFAPIAVAEKGFVDQGEISGAVALVATKDKVLYEAAVGTSDGKRAMETGDLFWIASMSKPITAAAAGMLVDDGKLSFDDPVSKYIPEFKEVKIGGKAPVREIAVRDLLTHTSGLGEYAKTQPHWTLEEFAKQIASQPLRFEPGSKWQYSTAGLDCVGRIVEVASGMPFDRFMQTRVFQPVGMKDTSFWMKKEDVVRYVLPYIRNTETKKLEVTKIPYMYGTEVTDTQRAPLGGAGLFSTAEDIAKFYQMMLNDGTTTGGQRILKTETIAAMTHNEIGELKARPGMPWGYGFCTVADPKAMDANNWFSVGTFGHGGAFGTSSWADPTRGMVYVLMLQRDKMGNPDNTPMHVQFQKLAAEGLKQ